MSFTQSSFGPISAHGNSDMPNIWTYRTSDTKEQVSQEGYFQDKINQMSEGDFLSVCALDGSFTAEVKKSSLAISLKVLTPSLLNRVVVTSSEDLAGTLLSTNEYFIDGIIDMGTQQIEVPQGGLNLAGYNFDISKLITSASNYTMFTSPVTGSGDLLGKDYAIEVTGTNSKVYDISSDTGLEAFEFARINYNDCTSLGTIDNYRQGLEVGTGRFGGMPELTLAGTWVGGYFIDTSIVRSLTDGAYSLFKAGAGFVMESRFRSNQNIDLPASASFFDFAAANFTNPSTLQIDGAIITRDGVSDSEDANITPNITSAELPSAWMGNQGMQNTFPGGTQTMTTEISTVIATINTFVDVLGTFVATDMQHFDSPANGQLRHLGSSPREYRISSDFVVDGTSNDVLAIKLVKWDNSASGFVDIITQRRQVNSLVGSRNVCFFSILAGFTLDQNDYVKLMIENQTAGRDALIETDSFYSLLHR